MDTPIVWLAWTGIAITPWKVIGYFGALLFAARWLVQMIASRRAGRPVIPRVFWIMSVIGSAMTLSYFVFSAKGDSVGVLQNLFPAATALYSLYLDIRHQRVSKGALVPRAAASKGRATTPKSPPTPRRQEGDTSSTTSP